MSLAAGSAHAGWYAVRNYVGTIGSLPIHLSLQTYPDLGPNDASRWRVDGSYYYDAHRIPIPLQGTRRADGTMQLCEAAEPASFGESPAVPAATPAHPVPCPISLKIGETGASGAWRDDQRTLPIALQAAGSLDDTGPGTPRLAGPVEIPMWHRTPRHLLLGEYRTSADCPLTMSRLRLVNLKTGKIDRELKFECGAGTVSTPIYGNVYGGSDARHVTVIFQGGFHGMGDDREIGIGP